MRGALLAVLVTLAGCAELLPPAGGVTGPRISLASLARLPVRWEGTWRSVTGASGVLELEMSIADDGRVHGRVSFRGATCDAAAPFTGQAEDDAVVLRAPLGPPCGDATIRIVESRERGRLTGSFANERPERGLFVIYPR